MNQAKEFIEYILNAIKIWIIVQPWERGLRVRRGKYITKLKGGIYFRIPYIDSIFIQSVRTRVISLPMQTLTSKDFKTITLNSAIGYCIVDVDKLYNNIFHPELTLSNMAMSEVSEFIHNNNVDDINPQLIENAVIEKLKAGNYGIDVHYFKLTNFAIVKTFRLIQDHSWVNSDLDMDKKS
ncbi:SPFH domain-containing protein [Pedobacter sp.]|uniref:SPFH domain-containing protein n=1 Tax=Pedobacter sp. TaxID=1411316 RepID=UPI00396CD86F